MMSGKAMMNDSVPSFFEDLAIRSLEIIPERTISSSFPLSNSAPSNLLFHHHRLLLQQDSPKVRQNLSLANQSFETI